MAELENEQAWDEYIEEAYNRGYNRESLAQYLVTNQCYSPELVELILSHYDTRIRTARNHAVTASAFVMLLGFFLLTFSMQPSLLGLATFDTADARITFANIERQIPQGFYGSVTGGITGNQSRIDTNKDRVPDTASNYQLHRQKILEAGVTQIRMDMDITNVYNRDGTFNKWNSCNTCNFDNHKSTVNWARQNNLTIRLVAAYMPVWLANVTPACSANPTRCEPNNYTMWQQAVTRYIEEVGCTVPGTKCVIEAWNEPYLGQFLLPGGTCTERTQSYFRLYDATRAAVKSKWPNMVVGGPVGFHDTSCSKQLTESFFRNYTQSQVDEFILHQYSSSGNNDLAVKLRDDIAWIRAAGHRQPLCFTEYNVNNAYISVNDQTRQHLFITEGMMEGLRADNISCLVLFEWTVTTQYGAHMGYPYPANYIMFSEPLLDNQERGAFTASRDFSAQHREGQSVVTTTRANNNLAVFATTGADGNGKRITVANRAASAKAFTLAFTDLSSGLLRNTKTNAITAVANGVATLPAIGAYGVEYYEYTTTTTPPPPVIVPPTVGAITIAGGAATIVAGNTAACAVTSISTSGATGNLTLYWIVNGASISSTVRTVTGASSSEQFSAPRVTSAGERWQCSASLITSGGTVTRLSAETLAVAAPDTTKPFAAGISPAALTNTTNTSVNFAWRASDERSSTLSCEIIVNDVVRATVNTTNNTNTSRIITLQIGSYDWYARCADGAQNTGSSAVRAFQVLSPNQVIVVPPNTSTNQSTNQTINQTSPVTNATNPITNQTGNQTSNNTNQTPNATGNQTNSSNNTIVLPNPTLPQKPTAIITVSGGTRRDDAIAWRISATSSDELKETVLELTSPTGRELSRTSYNSGIESVSVSVPDFITIGVGSSVCAKLTVKDTYDQITTATKCLTVTNSAPRAATPTFESASGLYIAAQELACIVTVEDLDETPLTAVITTTRNGSTWNSTSRSIYSGDVVRETVPANVIFASDVWACAITVSDGAASDSESGASITILEPPAPVQNIATPRRNSGGGGKSTVGGNAVTPPKKTTSEVPSTVTTGEAGQPEPRTSSEATPAPLADEDIVENPVLEEPSDNIESPLTINKTRQYTGLLGVVMIIIGAIGTVVALRRHPLPKGRAPAAE